MSDQQLIGWLKNGQYQKAMKGLYKSLPQLKKWVTNNSGNAHDAEDIFQDALVILCKKLKDDSFVLSAPLNTYIFSVGKNLWFAELRKRKVQIQVSDEAETISIDGNEANFDLAKQAFSILGEKCKEILILFYYKKKSMDEIANKVGLANEKVAKNQKYRCLEKAKENYIHLQQA
jgi:RNA polymerase sigma factor (sigma-70 family)